MWLPAVRDQEICKFFDDLIRSAGFSGHSAVQSATVKKGWAGPSEDLLLNCLLLFNDDRLGFFNRDKGFSDTKFTRHAYIQALATNLLFVISNRLHNPQHTVSLRPPQSLRAISTKYPPSQHQQ